MKKNGQKSSMFTLIELLVDGAIIAIPTKSLSNESISFFCIIVSFFNFISF